MKYKSNNNSWPGRIDFDYLENLDVDYYPAKIIYKSFFKVLNMPRVISSSFINLLSFETVKKQKHEKSSLKILGNQFFKVFDNIYSLDKNYKIKNVINISSKNLKNRAGKYGTNFSV